MDLLKLKLASSKMFRGFFTKFIERKIYEKLGYKINIQLNDLQIDVVENEARIHLDVDASTSKGELERFVEHYS